MEEKIKILILEDLPSDAELAEREVKAVLKNYKVVVTNTEQDFIEVLENFKPDLVISDYMLPAFNGMKALQIIRKKEEFIPFIIITGSINEETAVECMKAGADDYVIKEHIKRLGPAILVALDKKKIRQERKQAEEALRESETRNRIIAEMISDYAYIFRVTPEGELIGDWVTESFTNVFGYTLEEVDAQGGWQSLVYPDDLPIALAHAQKVARGEEDICEMRWVTARGEIRWLHDYAKPIFDETGKRVFRIYGASQDITERKQAEIELAKNEQRYRSVFENTGTAMIIINEDGSIAFANGQCTATTGYPPEELQGTDWRGYVFADDLPMMENYFRLRFSDPEKAPNRYETRLIHSNGSKRNCLLTVDTIPQTRQIVVSILDITDRKMAERALQESEEKYRSLIENSNDAIYLLYDRKFEVINKKFEEMLGVTLDDVNQPDFDFINLVKPEDREYIEKRLRDTADGKEVAPQYQFTAITLDGRELVLETSVSYIPYKNGIATQGILRDVTERIKAEKLIKKNLQEKEVLLKEVHHRVKNNLNVITSLLSLQVSKIKTEKQAIEAFKKSRDRIFSMAMVHEKLYQSGNYSEINMKEYIKTLLTNLEKIYHSDTYVVCNFQISDICIDINRAIPCGLIFNELITNALKHAFIGKKEGELTVSMKRKKIGMYEIGVKDNGTGLPEEIDVYKTGTLGLQLVRILAEQLDGKYSVEVKEGTEFQITFPVTNEKT